MTILNIEIAERRVAIVADTLGVAMNGIVADTLGVAMNGHTREMAKVAVFPHLLLLAGFAGAAEFQHDAVWAIGNGHGDLPGCMRRARARFSARYPSVPADAVGCVWLLGLGRATLFIPEIDFEPIDADPGVHLHPAVDPTLGLIDSIPSQVAWIREHRPSSRVGGSLIIATLSADGFSVTRRPFPEQ